MAKPTLYVLIGPSGSGKSTFAEDYARKNLMIVVSTDAIRKRLFGDEAIQTNGDQVFRSAYRHINFMLDNGMDVLFDATNTTKKGREQLFREIKREEYKKVALLFMTDMETCIRQNASRKRVVPNSVIERQYNQLMQDADSIPDQFDEVVVMK